MAVFSYKALSNISQNVGGTIAADTPRQARELLRERGLVVRDLSAVGADRRPRSVRRRRSWFPARRERRAQVTTAEGMKQAAIERGAPPENIFVVPDPIDGEEDPRLFPDADFLARRFGLASEAVSFFLPQFAAEEATELSASAISALEGFALASNELPQFNLLLEAPESARKAINEHAGRLGISAHVALVHQLDAPAAMQSVHVVVALAEPPSDPVAARQPNDICLKALWQGKTLLAADVPRNRDATPEGRGCLWFEAGSARDLGYRMAFLGRNPEFRAALGAAGRMYIFETRNGSAIGKKYDEAYRHAFSRKKPGGGPTIVTMETAENWG